MIPCFMDKKVTMIATLRSSIEDVWNTVTDNLNYKWRTDLSKIEVKNENTFIEYTKNGFETTFNITLKKSFDRYEFDIKNKNLTGHWTGIFSRVNSGTQIEFTEIVSVKNPIMRLLVKRFLKKQQATYLRDLRKALGEND